MTEPPTILPLGPQTFALLGRSLGMKNLGFLKLGDFKSHQWTDLSGAEYFPPAFIATGNGRWELASGKPSGPLFTAELDAGRVRPLVWELRNGVLISRHFAVRDEASAYIAAVGSDRALRVIEREKTWGNWRTLGGDSSEEISVAAEALNHQLFAAARSRTNRLSLWLTKLPVGESKTIELPVEIVGTPYAVAVRDAGGFLAIAATTSGTIITVDAKVGTAAFGAAQTIANGTKVLHASSRNGRTVVVDYLTADGRVASKTFAGSAGELSVKGK